MMNGDGGMESYHDRLNDRSEGRFHIKIWTAPKIYSHIYRKCEDGSRTKEHCVDEGEKCVLVFLRSSRWADHFENSKADNEVLVDYHTVSVEPDV